MTQTIPEPVGPIMPTTGNQPEPQRPKRRSVHLGGGREVIAILVLLALIFKGSVFHPLLLLLVVAICVWAYCKACFYFGKAAGITGVAFLGISIVTFVSFQFYSHRANEAFLTRIKDYDNVTVSRWGALPSSSLSQISFEDNASDADVSVFTALPELSGITDVHIEPCGITDTGLGLIDRWQKLKYIFIDCHEISDDAIVQFKQRHPDCQVVPYRRGL